ncbi:hypothetical protein [Enterococcus sp. AZ109]|uniref:hypothetical protein n=1 Tax=Enterococcus sp. AZ109 TaxID=2774634 RepID=UPI003F282B7C
MRKRGGRPKKITKSLLQKLEQGFLYGFTDEEACLHADISPSTLYNYCKEHPEFLERKEQLKSRPKMRAKLNIVRSLENGDVGVSQWYLERKAKDEFGNSQKIEHSGGIATKDPFGELSVEELRKIIQDG